MTTIKNTPKPSNPEEVLELVRKVEKKSMAELVSIVEKATDQKLKNQIEQVKNH